MEVEITLPINSSGDITIFRGATYSAGTTQLYVTAVDNPAFDVATDVPTVNIAGEDFTATATEDVPGTIIVTWDMTGAETADLPTGRLPYSVNWTRGAEMLPEIIAGYVTIEDIPGTNVPT